MSTLPPFLSNHGSRMPLWGFYQKGILGPHLFVQKPNTNPSHQMRWDEAAPSANQNGLRTLRNQISIDFETMSSRLRLAECAKRLNTITDLTKWKMVQHFASSTINQSQHYWTSDGRSIIYFQKHLNSCEKPFHCCSVVL